MLIVNAGRTSGTKYQGSSLERNSGLQEIATRHPEARGEVRGRGMMWGIAFDDPGLAAEVSRQAFRRGVLAEAADLNPRVLKIMPPLAIDRVDLDAGLEAVGEAVSAATRD